MLPSCTTLLFAPIVPFLPPPYAGAADRFDSLQISRPYYASPDLSTRFGLKSQCRMSTPRTLHAPGVDRSSGVAFASSSLQAVTYWFSKLRSSELLPSKMLQVAQKHSYIGARSQLMPLLLLMGPKVQQILTEMFDAGAINVRKRRSM